MSITHPKPRQIKLPFTVPRPGLSKSQPQRLCGICRKRDSQYTCPRCNIAYCSLDCFKAQSHVQCSEPFYKSTVMESIAGDPKAGLDEKKQMLEMLKRFEEAQADGEDLTSELNEELEEDELEKALAGIDLEEIDTNKLFHLLPQEHRDAFLEAIRNPESQAAKDLLDHAVGEGEEDEADFPNVLPWWEGGDILEDEEDLSEVAVMPEMISDEVVAGITPPAGVGISLVYNMVAISIAYLHVLLSFRLPSLDDQYFEASQVGREDIKREIATLLPFLVDPKSTVRFKTVSEAWAYVWDKIGEAIDPTPATENLIRLLSILLGLLKTSIIANDLPRIANAISDCYQLFAHPKVGAAAPRKLAFYFSAMRQISRDEWKRLESDVKKEVEQLQDETRSDTKIDTRTSMLNIV